MTFALPDPATPFGGRVAARLRDESIIWFVTEGADGTPQPNPVWFLWDGAAFLVYTMPSAARVKYIHRNPRVALHFNSDASGNDIIIFTGEAHVAPDAPSIDQNPPYLARYGASIDANFGGAATIASQYSLPMRITPTKVRGFLE